MVVLSLSLLYTGHIVLDAPIIVTGLECHRLWIHYRESGIPRLTDE
jgi:hypothetical protein